MYVAPFLTSDEANHNHLFIGMNSGNIHIFDIKSKQFTNFTIRFLKEHDKMQNAWRQFRVCDIKC